MKLNKYRRVHGTATTALIIGAAVAAAAAVITTKILLWAFLIGLAFFIGL